MPGNYGWRKTFICARNHLYRNSNTEIGEKMLKETTWGRDVSFSLSILIAGQSEKIMTVMYPNWAVVKTQRRKEIQTLMGFEPLASPVPVQCAYLWDLKPTRSWSLCEFVIHVYPRKMKVDIWNLIYIWTVEARKRKAGVVHLGCFLRSAV